MGLLSQGKPLDWDETKKYAKYVQERGIAQFISIYNESKDRADAPFKWGDEVEYILIKFDHRNRVARASLKAEEVFQRIEDQQKGNLGPTRSVWHPEFASYMIEGTPGIPYGIDGNLLSGLCDVEGSMLFRRQEVQRVLEKDESVMSLTSFPRLGCPNFTYPICHPKPETSASGSLFFPDEAIYGGHPRFKTLVKNIRARRRRKVIINLPIYKDINTQDPFIEHFIDEEALKAVKPDHVYMDAMGFGMGCCCLQITFQATHLEEAKVLYDQLAPITPIALALSAGSPIFRGFLTDRDCRWDVISCAVDDRTREESSETEELKESMFRIPKSRYDSISTYLSRQGQKFNDSPIVFDQIYYDLMVANNVEPAVARHIAHLFIRDPITLYKEKLDQSDQDLDHFENIQSTNWQTMRFKPPPYVNSPIGWRIEFRPMEAQTTDFENAAYVVFTILLSRVILAYKLNFLIPISLIDENMVEAQKRDAVRDSKFWFRRDIMHKSSSKGPLSTVLENHSNSSSTFDDNSNHNVYMKALPNHLGNRNTSSTNNNNNNSSRTGHDGLNHQDISNVAAKMTVNEIINGSESFVGLMPIIYHYVESFNDGSNIELINKINKYLNLISDRAALKAKTTARLIRDFVDLHPKYAHDSIINDEVAYDLLVAMDKIGKGEVTCPELLGESQATTEGATNNNNINCCFRQQINHHHQHQLISNGHSPRSINGSNSDYGNNAIVRKSSTLCNGLFNQSRKSPSARATKQSVDKSQEPYNSSSSSSSRSISR